MITQDELFNNPQYNVNPVSPETIRRYVGKEGIVGPAHAAKLALEAYNNQEIPLAQFFGKIAKDFSFSKALSAVDGDNRTISWEDLGQLANGKNFISKKDVGSVPNLDKTFLEDLSVLSRLRPVDDTPAYPAYPAYPQMPYAQQGGMPYGGQPYPQMPYDSYGGGMPQDPYSNAGFGLNTAQQGMYPPNYPSMPYPPQYPSQMSSQMPSYQPPQPIVYNNTYIYNNIYNNQVYNNQSYPVANNQTYNNQSYPIYNNQVYNNQDYSRRMMNYNSGNSLTHMPINYNSGNTLTNMPMNYSMNMMQMNQMNQFNRFPQAPQAHSYGMNPPAYGGSPYGQAMMPQQPMPNYGGSPYGQAMNRGMSPYGMPSPYGMRI